MTRSSRRAVWWSWTLGVVLLFSSAAHAQYVSTWRGSFCRASTAPVRCGLPGTSLAQVAFFTTVTTGDCVHVTGTFRCTGQCPGGRTGGTFRSVPGGGIHDGLFDMTVVYGNGQQCPISGTQSPTDPGTVYGHYQCPEVPAVSFALRRTSLTRGQPRVLRRSARRSRGFRAPR